MAVGGGGVEVTIQSSTYRGTEHLVSATRSALDAAIEATPYFRGGSKSFLDSLKGGLTVSEAKANSARIVNSPANPTNTPTTGLTVRAAKTIYVDPGRYLVPDMGTVSRVPSSTARTIGHELGHFWMGKSEAKALAFENAQHREPHALKGLWP